MRLILESIDQILRYKKNVVAGMSYVCCKCENKCIPEVDNSISKLLSPLCIQVLRGKSTDSSSIALMWSLVRMDLGSPFECCVEADHTCSAAVTEFRY